MRCKGEKCCNAVPRFLLRMGAFPFLIFLPPMAIAQGVTESLNPPKLLSTVSDTPQGSLSRASNSPSMTTSIISSVRDSTTSSTPTPTPDDNDFDPNQNFGPGGYTVPDNDTSHHTHSDVINYYFLFIAIVGVILAILLWWVHKRRRQRKEALRVSGQNALARDMDGWVNTRRWFHGAWRQNQAGGFVRREEGLNEHGEAPPPYQPKNEETSNAAVAPVSLREPAIPLRTLSRDENGSTRPPPDYRESLHIGTATIPHTHVTRPDTADVQPVADVRPDAVQPGSLTRGPLTSHNSP